MMMMMSLNLDLELSNHEDGDYVLGWTVRVKKKFEQRIRNLFLLPSVLFSIRRRGE